MSDQKSESRIQQEIFDWYWNTYCTKFSERREIIFHVPNEGKEHARLVNVGLVSGMSDLIATYRGRLLFIEVKTETGKQSSNQKKIEDHVGQVQGCEYYLVRSLEQFKALFI